MTEPKLIPFDTQRSDISIQGTFESELWCLFHDVPRLYSGLLHGLRDTGITPNSIKVDNGDGSLGGYNVQFWLFDFRVLVRVRLDRFEIRLSEHRAVGYSSGGACSGGAGRCTCCFDIRLSGGELHRGSSIAR